MSESEKKMTEEEKKAEEKETLKVSEEELDEVTGGGYVRHPPKKPRGAGNLDY